MSEACRNLIFKSLKENDIDKSVVEVRDLMWGKDSALKGNTFDLILGSDIIYIKDCFSLLLDTIIELSSPSTKTVIASTDHGNFVEFEALVQ